MERLTASGYAVTVSTSAPWRCIRATYAMSTTCTVVSAERGEPGRGGESSGRLLATVNVGPTTFRIGKALYVEIRKFIRIQVKAVSI